MRVALRPNPTRTRVSDPIGLPAPVRGWVTARPLIDMKPDSAVLLDNWFPEADCLRPRRGSKAYIGGLGGAVETLAVWRSGSTERLFAAAGPTIYDITDATKPPVPQVTGQRSARWQAVTYVVSGGPRLLLFNGVDQPLVFDGTTWSTLVLALAPVGGIGSPTPFDGTVLTGACAFANRLFVIAGTTAYYLPADQFQGTLSLLQVGAELARGGSLVALSRWAHDAGEGPRDTLVFVSDQGEVVAYQGSDPSSSSAWGLVGKFDVAPPIGARCLVKLGGDLGILTVDGLQPMSKAVVLDRAESKDQGALTGNIRNAFKAASERFGTVFGWQVYAHRTRGMLLVNVMAAEGSVAEQYVMNIATGAWTRFTGLNAICWASFGGNLYFGAANGRVIQTDVGYGDLGQPTSYPLVCAFTPIKGRGRLKSAKLMRALVMANVPLVMPVGVCTDYVLALPGASPPAPSTAAALWDQARWDDARWGSSLLGAPVGAWANASGLGNAFAPAATLTLGPSTDAAADIRLVGFDLLVEGGAPL